ncbi:hypothetical protein [Hydrogenophaga atypica]|uniref:Uncharacterized protein n=1 Tax=Hydrogenophaga atypica TaxID=249409 RepID=A0ABW2QKS2_9BURK
MDTRTADKPGQQVDVQARVQLIKAEMPETYKAIVVQAQMMGNEAYALVRRGLRGEANCFYAVERGHVVGTPFNLPDVQADMARFMVQFGCAFLVMWAPVAVAAAAGKGAADGAH